VTATHKLGRGLTRNQLGLPLVLDMQPQEWRENNCLLLKLPGLTLNNLSCGPQARGQLYNCSSPIWLLVKVDTRPKTHFTHQLLYFLANSESLSVLLSRCTNLPKVTASTNVTASAPLCGASLYLRPLSPSPWILCGQQNDGPQRFPDP
jgi:hypothetical protein